ncbi:hypothetical protein GBA52_001248 [Prunus armeniaca]|nr:hypothetical protein GBA52_001248 [Prunus armeniaca]
MASDMDLNAPHSMGTTIIGVTYNGGVVLGADSRTSTGVYVANRASDKITQLTDNVYVCRSGSAADSQVVSDYVRYFLHQHTIQLGQPATVKVCANLVRLLSYGNKNMLETGLIVGGWDKYEGGKIYGIPLGGTLLELPFTIGGSGSSYLYGFFDQAWKEGMTKDEAEQLVVKAVSLAIARDGASGGVVRTVVINSEGVTRNYYPGDKLPLWHEELEPQNSLLDILNTAMAMAQSQSLHKVFVYGSLMAEDVCRVLLNRVPQSSPAILNGYHRYSIKGRVYPAILPVENDKKRRVLCFVLVQLLLGITDPELHILDEFEDVEYERNTVEVSLVDSSDNLLVQAYVWSNKSDPNLYGDWNFEEWKQLHKKDFIKMTTGFMESWSCLKQSQELQHMNHFFSRVLRIPPRRDSIFDL